MNLQTILYRSGLLISVSVFVVSAALLGFFIVKVIRLVRQAHLVAVPLLEEQEVEFAEAGRVVLSIEGPRATRRFAGLSYELKAPGGTRVEGSAILIRPRTSGVSKVRLGVEGYEIDRPGRYTLRIVGLGAPQANDSEHRIVFNRPYFARGAAYVVGIVLSAVLMVGSTVLFFLRPGAPGGGA